MVASCFILNVGRIYLSQRTTHLHIDIQHYAELTFSVTPNVEYL